MAAIAGMLMLGVQQPVQAAVTQNDLAPPVSDASTHIHTHYYEDGYFETYHQSTYKYVYFDAEYIMRNAGLEETQAGIKIAGRNINIENVKKEIKGKDSLHNYKFVV